MRYRKKPVVIEAWQWDGSLNALVHAPKWVRDAVDNDWSGPRNTTSEQRHFINTLEGKMFISKGDYIIQGVQGEVYPCKPDIFETCYEVAI